MNKLPEEQPPVEDEVRFKEWLTRLVILINGVFDVNDSETMHYRGEWDYNIYNPQDVVYEGNWTMVCLNQTSDHAAPQLVGDQIWTLPDAPVWVDNTEDTNRLLTGLRIRIQEPNYIFSWEFWAPISGLGVKYSVYVVNDPLGTPSWEPLLLDRTITQIGWHGLERTPKFLVPDTIFDIVLLTEVTSTSTIFTGTWSYLHGSNDPNSGEIYQGNGSNSNRFKISEFDNTSNRDIDLQNLSAGSDFIAGGFSWTILSISKIGSYYECIVSPSVRIEPGIRLFTFSYYTKELLAYSEILNEYSSSSSLSGLIALDGSGVITENDNAYGIRVKFQKVSPSGNWGFLSYSKS